MIQLSFEPAYDSYSAMFRSLRLRHAIQPAGLPFSHFRILDFYLQFPFRLDEITLKQQDKRYKSVAKELKKPQPYGVLPPSRTIFERMRLFQEAAAQTLAKKGFFDGPSLERGDIVTSTAAVPPGLEKRVSDVNGRDSALMQFLSVLATYPLLGKDGLKARTRLLEYRSCLDLQHSAFRQQIELLPVLRTPSLGVLMEPEVGDGTTEFYARVQA